MFIDDDDALALIPPKLLTACVGLWALADSWSRRKGTGGFIPAGRVERLGGHRREAALLVSSGLWIEVEHGYQMKATVAAHQTAPAASGAADVRRERARVRMQRLRTGREQFAPGCEQRGEQNANGSQSDGEQSANSSRWEGKGGSEFSDSGSSVRSDLSVSPSPLGSESTQLSGCNAPARDEPPQPGRFRFELEELVRAAFLERSVTPPKAAASQWRDACQTVQDALDMGLYPDARAAMRAFAPLVVDTCAALGGKLGLALQQTTLGAQLKPVAPGGRQLSPLAQAAIERRRAEGV